MAEEEEAIVLDVIPDRSLPGEDGTAQNGVNVPGHEHLPPVPLPSPTSSSDGEKNKKKGIFLKLDTGALDKILTQIMEKVEYHDSNLGRLDVLEQEATKVKKFMLQQTLHEGSSERFASVTGDVTETPPAKTSPKTDSKVDSTDLAPDVAGNRPRTASTLTKSYTTNMTADLAQQARLDYGKHSKKYGRSAIDDEQDEYISKLLKEVTGLRTIVRQLQMEQDKDAATNLEFDHRLQGIKVDVLKFKRDFANMPSWEKLERELQKSNQETTNFVKMSQNALLEKLNQDNGMNLGKLEDWFSEHDTMAKRRQERVDKAVKSCARSNELEELRENLESDGEVMKRRIAAATQKLQEAVLNMQSMKEKRALQKLNKSFTGFMKKLTCGAFYKWKGMNDEVNDLIAIEKHRTTQMKRVLAMIFYRTLKLALTLWQKHTVLLVKHLAEQKRALKLMTKTMSKLLVARLDAGFKHWHRNTMFYREDQVRKKAQDDMERARRKSLVQGKEFTLNKTSGLGDIMKSFHNDTTGALDVITRELNALRFEEIAGLRRDWELEKVRNEFDSQNTLKNSLDQIGARADEFEKSMASRLGAISDMMPKMRTELSTQGQRVDGLETNVKKINSQVTKNTTSIDSILESLGRNEQRMFEVEDKVQGVKGDVGQLQEGEKRALGLIEDLTHKLSDAEEREEKLKQQLADTVSYFEAEMRGLRDIVLGTKEKAEYLDEALGRERDYLRKFEENTVEDATDLRRMVEFSGVLKPKMELMINACLPYEQLSFEKKYCPPINSPALDIYIPDAIAAFSVDMAAWIAFKADHEAMSRVVSGVNPEEIVYADEEIELRRRSLIEEVRFEFRRAVEAGNPDAGALRLEARHKFQARLIDSIDSALSKHDQVLITGSSRASRVKAAVPACVACDRPLRTKARKGKLMEEEGIGANSSSNNNTEEPQVIDKLKGQEGMPGYGSRRPQSADPRLRRDPSAGGFVGGRSGGGGDLQPIVDNTVTGAVGSAGAPYVLRSGFKMPRAKQQLTPMADTQRRPYSPEERIGELTNTINYGEREA